MDTPDYYVLMRDGRKLKPCSWAAKGRGRLGFFHDFETLTEQFLGAQEYGEPTGFFTGGEPGTAGMYFYPIEEMLCIQRIKA